MEIEFFDEQGAYEEDRVNEVKAGIAAWNGLIAEAGFDLSGVFRRRKSCAIYIGPSPRREPI
jgi:hypothetical protein